MNELKSEQDFIVFDEIDFRKYLLIIKKNWVVAATLFFGIPIAAVTIAFLQKPVYKSFAKVQIINNENSSLVGLDSTTGEIQKIGSQNDPLSTQSELVQSIPIAEEVINTLDLRDNKGELISIKDFRESLTVKAIPKTDILEISFNSENPAEASAVVDKVVDLYTLKNIEENRAQLTAARDFIIQQLPDVENSVRLAELGLKNFQAKNNVTSVKGEIENLSELSDSVDRQISNLNTELSGLEARAYALEQELNLDVSDGIALASLSQSRGVQSALEEYQRLQEELASQKSAYSENHPIVTSLERQLEAANGLLGDRINQVLIDRGYSDPPKNNIQLGSLQEKLIENFVDVAMQNLEQQEKLQSLLAYNNFLSSRISELSRLEQPESELARQLNASQKTYEILLTRLQEVRVTENQTIGNARIISRAFLAEDPVSPRKKLYLAAGLFLGSMSAISYIFLMDLFDPSIKTLKDVKEAFGLPILGIIPLVKSKPNPKIVSAQDSFTSHKLYEPIADTAAQSPYGESLRILWSTLSLTIFGDEKMIAITSALAGEGKSTMAASIAAIGSSSGKKVLLIDGDIRKPSQNKIWGFGAIPKGFSDFLNDEVELDEVVVHVNSNLDIIPTARLDSAKLDFLSNYESAYMKIDSLKKKYDLIVLDSPPLLAVSEAARIVKMAGSIILVSRPGVGDFASASVLLEKAQQLNLNIVGIIANAVRTDLDPYSYGYSYGKYDYSYGK